MSEKRKSPGLDNALAVLNGALGDYLARTDNGLATEMDFYRSGAPDHAPAQGRVVVFVHGLMCTEDIWRMPDGEDYGSLLARAFGVTARYVRYNTGLAIPDNGAAFDRLLTDLVAKGGGAIEEIILVGYSMGGLVARSACHVASGRESSWLGLVHRAFYVGTPHLGAPMERVGRVVSKLLRVVDDPVTKLLADLADLRSDGVKDLGDADVRHEDRARRAHGFSLRDPRHPVPLLPAIQHHLVAGTLFGDPTLAAWFGDAIVPLGSARGDETGAGGDAPDETRVRVVEGLSHLDIPHHPRVYAELEAWFKSGEKASETEAR